MKRREELPELLAPAGSMKALYAAVMAGADAVYVGGKSFGARAFAENFDTEGLKYAVKYTHLHGVKLYVTVNTLVYDKELSELSDYVAMLSDIGVDAVITADIGVIKEIRRRAPSLPIHASTQMSVHNTPGADAAYSLGCERVVLARELPLSEIRSVVEGSVAEIEIFLHGALCVCHSGQCLMSSLVGGRSGNRGECAQPCRLPYNGKYPLSLSDLSLAEHIPELISSGVSSLKIEGRMKSPEYVYTVTKIYRALLDGGRGATKKEIAELERIFSRGRSTDGYFKGDKFAPMTGVRSEADKENTKSISETDFQPLKKRVYAEVKMKLGEPSEMRLSDGKRSVTALGAAPTEAISSPLSAADVKARLSKMGATMLSLSPEDISLELDDGINLPPSAVNALRRDAAAMLEDASAPPVTTTKYVNNNLRNKPEKIRTALFLNSDEYTEFSRLYPHSCRDFDIVFLPLESYVAGALGVYLPPVAFDSELPLVKELLKSAMAGGARYALVGNIGEISLALDVGLIPIGDFRLNVTNSESRAEYARLGVEHIILSPELTLPKARDIGGAEITYGRIPLMITERCFIKENFGCDKCGSSALTDRTGKSFPLLREFGHRNLILNSLPTYMADRQSELDSSGIVAEHLIFTTESAQEIAAVMASYKKHAPLGIDVRRIGKR